MGTEAAWVPLALTALGAGTQVFAAEDQKRQQANIVTQGIDAQTARQHEADAAVNEQVQALQKSSPEAERAQAAEAFITQLRRSHGQASGDATPGAVSNRYLTDETNAQQGITEFGTKAADTLARIAAPVRQRQAEGQNIGRLGQTLGTIGRNSSADDFLTQLRLQRTTANPWLQAGGQVATGVGAGMASNGYGTAAKVPKTNPKLAGDFNLTGSTRGFA